ncbi:MAG: SDR family NAD(P)-dependent oxidoreductase [Ferrimicrobium sp.]
MVEKLEVALVTGAGRNIGRAIALDFAQAGLKIAVNNRSNLGEGDKVVSEIRSIGGEAVLVQGDVSDPEAVALMVRQTEETLGPVDVLVNNAAVRPHTSFVDMTLEEWNWVVGVGLTGAFLLSKAVVPGMIAKGGGCIINISGRDGFVGRAARAHGSAVKAGLHGFTKAIAKELGPLGIRVNTVVPSLIDTTRPAEWYPNWEEEMHREDIPLGHMGRSEDIARACTYLLEAGYVTGQALHVNGGVIMV